jgi:hypothetical protein
MGWGFAVHFDGRQLKPYAEPCFIKRATGGAVYFAVNYVDDEMLIPLMETLVLGGLGIGGGPTVGAGASVGIDICSVRLVCYNSPTCSCNSH